MQGLLPTPSEVSLLKNRIEKLEKEVSMLRSKLSGNKTLHILNFENLTQDQFESIFLQYGDIVNILYKSNYAFVEYATVDSSKAAYEGLRGYDANGKKLKVNYAIKR